MSLSKDEKDYLIRYHLQKIFRATGIDDARWERKINKFLHDHVPPKHRNRVRAFATEWREEQLRGNK